MLWYVLFGALVYGTGVALSFKVLRPRAIARQFSSPVFLAMVVCAFVFMLVVSWLVGRFLLDHVKTDWVYVLVNSAVATFVFYFGLSIEEGSMNLPD